jgi:hypothetical protein
MGRSHKDKAFLSTEIAENGDDKAIFNGPVNANACETGSVLHVTP